MVRPQEASKAGSSLDSGNLLNLCGEVYAYAPLYFSWSVCGGGRRRGRGVGRGVYRFFRSSAGFGHYLVTKFKPLLWEAELDFLITGSVSRRPVHLEAKVEAL